VSVARDVAQTLPGVDAGIWQVRTRFDKAAVALADRHYSRRPDKIGSNQVGGVSRNVTLVTPCERALWVTRYMLPGRAFDKLDAYRCSYFRNEGAGLSSTLIVEAMRLTVLLWEGFTPPDGWVTWIRPDKIASAHPGYCFKKAGWWLDREWSHPQLVRLRA
jgi:hypothetical protein